MNTVLVYVVDSANQEVADVRLQVSSTTHGTLDLTRDEESWIATSRSGALVTIDVKAPGFEPESHQVQLRNSITQVVIGLRKPDEISYNLGDSRLSLQRDDRSFLLRVRGKSASERVAAVAQGLNLLAPRTAVPGLDNPDDAYVQLFATRQEVERMVANLRHGDLAVKVLRVIRHGDGPLVGLGNEISVRFKANVTPEQVQGLLRRTGMRIERELPHAENAYLISSDGFPTYDVLKVAEDLNRLEHVMYAEPNLTNAVESDQYVPNDPLWSQVPYLKLINADDAWELLAGVAITLRGGSPDITIAVIDDEGVSPIHPDLIDNVSDGTSKLVESNNFTGTEVAVQTEGTLGGDHGTQCAGTATAAFDNYRGIPGVAPNCHLIGAHISKIIDDAHLCDVLMHVAGLANSLKQLGGIPLAPPTRAADVISISWGINAAPLSRSAQDCLDTLTTLGRGGKGCVVCFSIGNSGYLNFTTPTGLRYRGWPTYEKVLGVGASIGRAPKTPLPKSGHPDPSGKSLNIAVKADTRALYSPYGTATLRKPDLVAPSSTAMFSPPVTVPETSPHADPVLSLVRIGTGTNGCSGQATCNDYAKTFGGTSQSTPMVAGAAALILSANPALTAAEVRDILRKTCAHVDRTQANAVGRWRDLDGDQKVDFSRWYGAGRLDVGAAVAKTLAEAPATNDVPVG